METFRRSLNVNIKSIMGKMRININVEEIQRDTIYTKKKYSHVESRNKFGANRVFLSTSLRVQFLNE